MRVGDDPPNGRGQRVPTLGHRRGSRRRVAAAGLLIALAGYGWYRSVARSRVDWRAPGGAVHEGVLHARLVGTSGSPIVLLHGFLGSGRSWGAEFDLLGANHRVIVPDLRGFGASPKPASGYSLDEHADAVAALLSELRVDQPALLVGHSFGGVVALHLAARHPGLTRGVLAFGPPLYANALQAHKRVVKGDPMGGLLLLDGPFARRSCIWFHEHPVISAILVQLWRPDLPAPLARDSARHTWASYSGTLEGLIAAGDTAELVRSIHTPIRFVVGEKDGVADRSYLATLSTLHPKVTLRIVTGASHDLPLTHPRLCRREIEAAVMP